MTDRDIALALVTDVLVKTLHTHGTSRVSLPLEHEPSIDTLKRINSALAHSNKIGHYTANEYRVHAEYVHSSKSYKLVLTQVA